MNEASIYRIFMFLGYIVKFIFILIPIILIVIGTIDIIKYLINPNNNKDAIKIFVKRIILSVLIFFVPTIVSFIMNLIDQNMNTNLFKCFADPSFCSEILKSETNNCNDSSDKNECCKFILNNNNALYNTDVNECSLPISSLIK